jgi:hypothetical protein
MLQSGYPAPYFGSLGVGKPIRDPPSDLLMAPARADRSARSMSEKRVIHANATVLLITHH